MPAETAQLHCKSQQPSVPGPLAYLPSMPNQPVCGDTPSQAALQHYANGEPGPSAAVGATATPRIATRRWAAAEQLMAG